MNLITSNEFSVSSYELWKKLNEFRISDGLNKVRHDDFLSRVVDECDDLGVCETFAVERSNVILKKYTLNQDQAILVGMRESKAIRRKVLEWLKSLTNQMASNQPPTPQLPQNYLEALEQLVEKEKLLIAQAPKVAFVDNLVERKNLLNATQVAQPHKMSAMKLNKMLDEYGGVYSKAVKRGRVFCQPWIDGGFGEMKVTETGFNQCLFTTLGEQRINEILVSEGAV